MSTFFTSQRDYAQAREDAAFAAPEEQPRGERTDWGKTARAIRSVLPGGFGTFTENLDGTPFEGVRRDLGGAFAAGGEGVNVRARQIARDVGPFTQFLFDYEGFRERVAEHGNPREDQTDRNWFDRLTSENIDYWAEKRREMAVDPATRSEAANLVGDLTRMLGTFTFAGLATGNPFTGAYAASGSFEAADYEHHIAAGVDPETARGAAAITGWSMFAMGLAPVSLAGKLWQRAASGAAINLGFGAGMRGSTSAYLRTHGYEDLAEQYQWLDPRAATLDAVLGAAFGSLFGRRAPPGIRPHAGAGGVEAEAPVLPRDAEGYFDEARLYGNSEQFAEAYAYALIAKDLGHPEADGLLAQIEGDASPADLAEGQALASRIALSAAGAGLRDNGMADAAMVEADSIGRETAFGIPHNRASARWQSEALDRMEGQAARDEPVDPGQMPEGVGYVPLPETPGETFDAALAAYLESEGFATAQEAEARIQQMREERGDAIPPDDMLASVGRRGAGPDTPVQRHYEFLEQILEERRRGGTPGLRRTPPAQIPEVGTREYAEAVLQAREAQQSGQRLTEMQRALIRWEAENPFPEGLFSRADARARPAATVEALTAAAQREFGADWDAYVRADNVEIVPSHAALASALRAEGRERQVRWTEKNQPAAAYFRRQKKAYFIADRIAPEDMRGLVLHEIGEHHGMEAMLGERGYREALRQLDRMVKEGNPIVARAREWAETYAPAKDVPSETWAYLIEHNADLPIVHSVLSRLRQWLIRTFGSTFGMRLTVDDLRALAVASFRRGAERARREARSAEGVALGRDREGVVMEAQASGYAGKDTGEAVEWTRAVAKGLPMDEASRMERAREMGFGVDRPLYHGTLNDFSALDRGKIGSGANASSDREPAFFFSPDPRQANRYVRWNEFDPDYREGANVLPVYVRGNLKQVDMQGRRVDEIVTDTRNDILAALKAAQAEGFEGVRFVNFVDMGTGARGAEQVAIFSPSSIRSRFAAFDPDYRESADLLASTGKAEEAQEAYDKLDPVDQVLLDDPGDIKASVGSRRVSAREGVEAAKEAEVRARELRKGSEAAARCAVRHGGSMAGRSLITLGGLGPAASTGHILGMTAAIPVGIVVSNAAARNADPVGYAARRARTASQNLSAFGRAAGEAAGLDAPSPPPELLAPRVRVPSDPSYFMDEPVEETLDPPRGFAPPDAEGGEEPADDAEDLMEAFRPLIEDEE